MSSPTGARIPMKPGAVAIEKSPEGEAAGHVESELRSRWIRVHGVVRSSSPPTVLRRHEDVSVEVASIRRDQQVPKSLQDGEHTPGSFRMVDPAGKTMQGQRHHRQRIRLHARGLRHPR
ncbi:hypothetical protein QJS66_15140 [Kocuria rhizophila]|nr:hypothetical protein QJS66_15140 [Kocuria rhizophila]